MGICGRNGSYGSGIWRGLGRGESETDSEQSRLNVYFNFESTLYYDITIE